MKKIMKKVFCLPPVPTLLISIPSYVLVIYVLSGVGQPQVISYPAYILSAYAFIITVTGLPDMIRWVRAAVIRHPLTRMLMGIPLFRKFLMEAPFRTEISLYPGLFMNLAYTGIKLFSGIYYRSLWFVALAGYYFLLAVMRFSLLHHMRKNRGRRENKASEWHRYRLCGIILLVMDMALVVIIVLIVYQNSAFQYSGLLIYAMAVYAFYAVTLAVWNVVKYRKYGSPVMSAAKAVSLTAALVSMLSLETALVARFGADDNVAFRRGMSAFTGAGVSVIVVGMAAYMIIQATKQLRMKQGEMSNDKHIGAGR